MVPYCFTEGRLANFGDDLNRWLWKRLIPNALKQNDNTLLCAIGTVLVRDLLPSSKKYIVFTSGVGYGPPPSDFGSSDWSVSCVRGPLTAQVLGLRSDMAVADGALLISLLPECQPLPESERHGVVFMPHYEALHAGDWEEAARRAGVEFLNPHSPSEITIQRIRSAKLVLADAMHAAIVADAMRVPWVPLMTSKQINTFKWLDWTLSLDLPYLPLKLPASSLIEALRDHSLGLYGHAFSLPEKTEAAALAHFHLTRQRKQRPLWPLYSRWARRITYSIPRAILGLGPIAARLTSDSDKRLDACADSLRAAATSTSYLSNLEIFSERVAELKERLKQFS